jgi:GTP-binding protein
MAMDNLVIKVINPQFIYSVPRLALMRKLNPEIAFIGRSNAGKSSLLNSLCQKKDLARTSKTPGRTRHAVVYGASFLDHEQKDLTLVDLPGFGFASMSKTEASECEKLIFSYLQNREELKKIILILDIRRDLDERELKIIEIAHKRDIELVLVLTKADKVPLAKRKPILNKFKGLRVLLHSNQIEELTEKIREVLIA